jgi:DNA-binding transcriptional ArsR family regulator
MDDLIQALKAVGDETRFLISNLLLTNDLCVGALAKHLDISNAAVSQHLQILRETGLMRGEKRGYWTHYSVDGFRELVLLCGFIRNVEKGTPDPCA